MIIIPQVDEQSHPINHSLNDRNANVWCHPLLKHMSFPFFLQTKSVRDFSVRGISCSEHFPQEKPWGFPHLFVCLAARSDGGQSASHGGEGAEIWG